MLLFSNRFFRFAKTVTRLSLQYSVVSGYFSLIAAITGFAGPTGGVGENPIGTIYIGMHAPGGDWSKQLFYPGPRCAVKERAVTAAIDWLRREVVKESKKAAVPLAN